VNSRSDPILVKGRARKILPVVVLLMTMVVVSVILFYATRTGVLRGTVAWRSETVGHQSCGFPIWVPLGFGL